VPRPAVSPAELKDRHRAAGIRRRHLAVVRLARQPDTFAEAVVTRGDGEPGEDLLVVHRLPPFQVVDGVVDRLEQPPRPREPLLQRLAVRPQRIDALEVGPAEELPDLPQLEAQLPVEEDLLQGQQLRLLVEAIPVCAGVRRLQQPLLVVEVQRADADARQRRHLLHRVRHRSPSPVDSSPNGSKLRADAT
jgi:hypothetical protein